MSLNLLGWGFCSTAPSQSHCTSEIPDTIDSTPTEVSLLSNDYCVQMLEANLKVEQPGVQKSEYQNLQSRNGIVCIGQNYSRNFDQHGFYSKDYFKRFTRLELSDTLVNLVTQKGQINRHEINGN